MIFTWFAAALTSIERSPGLRVNQNPSGIVEVVVLVVVE